MTDKDGMFTYPCELNSIFLVRFPLLESQYGDGSWRAGQLLSLLHTSPLAVSKC